VVVNFAAETHVDRSIAEPGAFVLTDMYGTYALLEAFKATPGLLFVQISTDEVYGSIEQGEATEESRSPAQPVLCVQAGLTGWRRPTTHL